MITHLSQSERPARLRWQGERIAGTLGALGRSGTLTFQAKYPAELLPSLPKEATAATVLFRIRGLSFEAETRVLRAEGDKGRVVLQPDYVEWSATSIRLGGRRYHRGRAELALVGLPRKKTPLQVVAMTARELWAVAWPCPKELREHTGNQGTLAAEGLPSVPLQLALTGTCAVFPGCRGRIVKVSIGDSDGRLTELLQHLEGAQDRRGRD